MMRTSFAALTAAAILWAAPTMAQEAHSVKRVFKQGETDRYQTTIKFEQSPTEAVMVTTEVTREVKADGVAVVATTVDSIVLKARDTEMPFPGGSGQVVLTTYDPNGKPVKQETLGGKGNIGQLLNIARPNIRVDKPLKVGDTVEEDVPLGSDGKLKAHVTISLTAIDRKSAELPSDCLRYKIVSETKAPAGEGATRSEIVARVSMSDGKLISAEGTMEGIPMPGGGTTRVTYKVVRKTEPPAK